MKKNIKHADRKQLTEQLAKEWGQRLREMTKKLGIKRQELADYLNVSPATVSRITAGQMSALTMDQLFKLCGLATSNGYTVTWLMTGHNDSQTVPSEAIMDMHRVFSRLEKEPNISEQDKATMKEILAANPHPQPKFIGVHQLPDNWQQTYVPCYHRATAAEWDEDVSPPAWAAIFVADRNAQAGAIAFFSNAVAPSSSMFPSPIIIGKPIDVPTENEFDVVVYRGTDNYMHCVMGRVEIGRLVRVFGTDQNTPVAISPDNPHRIYKLNTI